GGCQGKIISQLGIEFGAGLAAHSRHQQQQPVPTQGILGVGQDPQIGQDVLDVGAFHELEAADLDEVKANPGQFDLQVEGMITGPHQHRYLFQGEALSLQLLYLGNHQAGLLVFAGGAEEPGPPAVRLEAEQTLGVLFPGPGNDRVGQVQDGLGAAVVLLQLDDLGPGEQPREVHDVAEIGAPE